MAGTIKLSDVAHKIRDADPLLWRPTNVFGQVIAAAGRGEFSHGSMAGTVQSPSGRTTIPTLLEVAPWVGGRETGLGAVVEKYPGRIVWFSVNRKFCPPADGQISDPDGLTLDREQAVKRMRQFVGCKYGWPSVIRCGLAHLPFPRRWLRVPDAEEYLSGETQPFCSEAMAIAYIAGGIDPVPELENRLTEPCDLARSFLFERRGALVP